VLRKKHAIGAAAVCGLYRASPPVSKISLDETMT
jgi:hypothetical protein